MWGEVQFKVAPDGTTGIHLMLDGQEYTTECVLNPLTAFSLGQALVRVARMAGLPPDIDDAAV